MRNILNFAGEQKGTKKEPETIDDNSVLPVYSMTIKLDLKSPELSVQCQLAEIAKKLAKSRKIVTVTGAGISCNAGIPDFRSKKGLYNLVKEKYPDAVFKGKDLFDTILFSNPQTIAVFFTFMAALRKSIVNAHPTPTHSFIRHLKEKGRLLRCYTQNIDGLESREGLNISMEGGLRDVDVVQLHGDIHQLKCTQCCKSYPWDEELEELLAQGEAPSCPACKTEQDKRQAAGKRYTGVGFLRPKILLYGEEHPDSEMIGQCTIKDIKANPDCLIIFGTSLKVIGARKLVRAVAKAVNQRQGTVLLVNDTELCSKNLWKDVIDVHIQADCDEWVTSLRSTIPDFFKIQSKLPKYPVTKSPMPKTTKRAHAMKSPPSTPYKIYKMGKSSSPSKSFNPLPISALLDSPTTPRRSPRLAQMSQEQTNYGPIPFKLDIQTRQPLAPVVNGVFIPAFKPLTEMDPCCVKKHIA